MDPLHLRENHGLEDGPREEEEDLRRGHYGKRADGQTEGEAQGIAAESLVASMCVLGSDGELNVATSLVDDEGVDLVFYRSTGGPTLSVQVKSHFYDAPEKIERRGVNALLNPRVFSARDDLYLLFLVVDQYEARVQTAWLVPSVEFSNRRTGKNLRFQASADPDSGSPWAHFLVDPLGARELAGHIMSVLARLA